MQSETAREARIGMVVQKKVRHIQTQKRLERWFGLPERERAAVLNNMRVDYESWRDQWATEDEYPQEGKLRAEATKAAIELLGGSVEWPTADGLIEFKETK